MKTMEKTVSGNWPLRAPRLALLGTLCLLAVALHPSRAQADFGFTEINSTGNPSAPAFPSQRAVWSGTCDLAHPMTGAGGIGTAPTLARDCIDIGTVPLFPSSSDPWGTSLAGAAGIPPSWRLDPVAQAGAHPDGTASLFVKLAVDQTGLGQVDGNVKDVAVHLPPGVVGDPTALPRCSAAAAQFIPPECSAATQVGTATVALRVAGGALRESVYPVYGVEPRKGAPAEFTIGSVANSFNVPVAARARTGADYGIDALALTIPTSAPLYGQAFTFWGLPFAPDHDSYRIDGKALGEIKAPGGVPLGGLPVAEQTPWRPGWGPVRPFFTNPTRCSGAPPTVGIESDSWQKPGATLGEEGVPIPGDPNWKRASIEQPLVSGCKKVPFKPTISLTPTVHEAESPTGLDVGLETPQNEELPFPAPGEGASAEEAAEYAEKAAEYWQHNPAGLATAHLKDTTVVLPAGVALTPAAANGLGACTTRQIGLTTTAGADPAPIRFDNDAPTCPDSSKIGTLSIHTPLLPEPLEGTIYLAAQSDNPFGSLFAIYLYAHSDARNVTLKLAGEVKADPVTGQLTTTFRDNPQLPLQKLELHFRSGAAAPLATPQACGAYTTHSALASWARPGEPVNLESPFRIDQGANGSPCVAGEAQAPNSPSFEAGTTSPRAGTYSPFVLKLSRPDGSQRLGSLTVNLPPGLTGRLAGVPYCPESAIAAAQARDKPGDGAIEMSSASCPAASQIGTATVGAGAGPKPYFAQGKVYLAGPYKGAPLSLVVITPAVAGPFDLGTVVVRTALEVNPETAQITAKSDPLPTILQGVPLDLRSIAIDIDRPGFTLNPTNCEAMALGGTATSLAGQKAPLANRFQVDGCAGLGFDPQLKLRLKGATGRTGHPALRAVVTMPAYAGEESCAPQGRRAARLARKANAERRKAGHAKSGAARRRLRSAARRDSRKARSAHRRAKRCLATATSKEADIRRAQVNLPHSEFLDQGNLDKVCTKPVLMAGHCPKSSIYGWAKAWTPLLAQPLQGHVYLVGGYGYKLPALVADLNGQIRVTLVGKVDSGRNKGIRNTFEVVPDAPVSRFELRMKGGKKYGLLVNSENLCKAKKSKRRAIARFNGQNGKVRQWKPLVANQCGGQRKAAKRERHRAR